MKTFKNILKLCTLGLLVLGTAFAANADNKGKDRPDYATSLIPDSLSANANQVYRKDDLYFEVRSNKSGRERQEIVVTILNENSSAHFMSVFYDEETKVKDFEARIYDQDGKLIRELDKDEILDFSAVSSGSLYEDDRKMVLNAQHTSYPYTVEFYIERELKGLKFHSYPDWFVYRFDTGFESSSYTLEIPSDLPFYHRMLNMAIEPVIKEEKKNKIYRWEVSNLPPIEAESFAPVFSDRIPILLVSPHLFEVDNYEGSMATWDAYGRFMYELWEGQDELPKEVRAKVAELTAGLTTDREKIEVLYRFMQSQMRYVSVQLGIGGFKPFDADYVWKNKFGDCKALTNFMKGMLREAGIESYPALIKSGNQVYRIFDDFANPSFNHVILYVPKSETWLECTSQTSPVNYLGSGTEGRKVLLIKPEGGQLYETRTLTADDNISSSKVVIKLQEDGAASVKGSIHTSGIFHEPIRSLDNSFSEEELKKYFLNVTSFPSPKIQSISVQASADSPEGVQKFELDVKRYASKAGKRLFLPINLVNSYDFIPEKEENRKFDIHYNYPKLWQDTITIEIPENYMIEGIPDKDLNLKTDYGSYEMHITQVGNRLRYARQFKIERTVLPAEEYDNFRNFLKEVSKAEKMKIVLAKKRT